MKQNIIIAILILFALIFIGRFYKKVREGYDNNDYHIVVAKYKKDVSFLEETGISYTVIDKNTVPNKAHEATSYLHYIIQNYDNLPKNTIFIHDENESWHHQGKITENVHSWIEEYEKQGSTYYEFNFNAKVHRDTELYDSNGVYRDYYKKCLQKEIGSFYEATPELGQCCAQFIVSRDRIRFRSKEFYQNIYDWLVENTEGEGNGKGQESQNSGYWTSRYLEFTWRFIFNGKRINDNE
jgi:hypothetical protein